MRTNSWMLVTLLAAAVAAATATTAAADPAPSVAVTQVDGTVTGDTTKLPLAGVTVFIATTGGLEQTVVTDDGGYYHAELQHTSGPYSVVFMFGAERTSRHFEAVPNAAIHMDTVIDDRGELIDVHDHIEKARQPVPLKDMGILPRYSDRAALGNYWAKAWMLLEIDRTGAVSRAKFLKRPGYDLDGIALETALKLKFKPGLDERGHPETWHVIYPIEWPSMWWVIGLTGIATHTPMGMERVPCEGGRPHDQILRDCSEPDLGKGANEPWVSAR